MKRIMLLALLIPCCHIAWSQSTNSGDVRGTVSDSTGAVVADVEVQAKNVATGIVKEVKTNGSGIYDFVSILPGPYILSFDKIGFGRLTKGPITLEVGYITVNAVLQIGEAKEEVTVFETLPLLKTDTAEQSTTYTAETMTELPNLGVSWDNFVALLPGVQGSGTSVAVNGTMPYYDAFLADGASTTLSHSSNTDESLFESVAEVQINTSTFSAQYGTGGAVFNQISKGGTNAWHGSLFEYMQTDKLNARNWFDQTVGRQHTNRFGGSIGGPILKNKMFFFFNPDRIVNNGTSSGFATVPTGAMLAGNLAGLPQLYDPKSTHIASNGSWTRDPIPNNDISTMIDPVAAKIAAYWPKANRTGVVSAMYPGEVSNNYYYQIGVPDQSSRYFGRLDYDITKNNRLTLSVTERDRKTSWPGIGICPVDCTNIDIDGYETQASDVWSPRSHLVNEFRVGFTRQGNYFQSAANGKNYPDQLNWQYAKGNDFPTVYSFGPCCSGVTVQGTDAYYIENIWSYSDVVTYIRGKHILHFGGEFDAAQDNSYWGTLNAGTLSFNGYYTMQNATAGNTGLGYADFLMGNLQAWSASVNPIPGMRQKIPQFFAQDDIKLRPNLTVNLGLRYQVHTGWSEIHNFLGAFDPNLRNDSSNSLGAIWFAGTSGRNALQATVKDVVLPRIGFSWQPQEKMTIRGGFGIYGLGWSLDQYGAGTDMGASSSGSASDTTMTNPVATLSGLNAQLPWVQASRSATAYNGQNVSYNAYHTPVARLYQWSFGTQYQISQYTVAELNYVASHGQDLLFPTDLNQVPESELSPNDQQYRPFPQYLSISGNTYNAVSNYNSLQAQYSHHFHQGVTYNVAYTWSHMLSDQDSGGMGGSAGSQLYQVASDPHRNYASSNFDARHMLKAYVVYSLPFGQGERWNIHNKLADGAFGGWQTSWVFQGQTGLPFTPVVSNPNLSYAQAGSWFPNLVGNPNPGHKSIHEWYNPTAYKDPTPGTFGNAGRNSLRAPGAQYFNASLAKNFPLLEKSQLQIRIDANNVFNHQSFGAPDSGVDDASAGQITTVSVGGRNMQLGARFFF